MALYISGQTCVLREVSLQNKPEEMRRVSPKATVPVLVLPEGTVLEESLDIMFWALGRNDPRNWLSPKIGDLKQMKDLIAHNDDVFKNHLDRYKYATRYEPGTNPIYHRNEGAVFLNHLEERLTLSRHLFGDDPALVDVALFPFIRQFANADRDWFDQQNWPGLLRWLNDHLASELFSAIMQKWGVWRPGADEVLFH